MTDRKRGSSARRQKAFFVRHGFECFFTGLMCTADATKRGMKRDGNSSLNAPLDPTVEHLISGNALKEFKAEHAPKDDDERHSAYHDFYNTNCVPCASFINNIVSHAPMNVKLALKKYLTLEVRPFNYETDEEAIAMYSAYARTFLDTYRIGHYAPWNAREAQREHQQDNIVRELFDAYMDLLTPLERQINGFMDIKPIRKIKPTDVSNLAINVSPDHITKIVQSKEERKRISNLPKGERFHLRRGFKCFYTGIEMEPKTKLKNGTPHKMAPTIEHLIPHSTLRPFFHHHRSMNTKYGYDHYSVTPFFNNNRVTCVNFMNHVVSVAPLKVKFGLRDYLHSFSLVPGMTNNEIRTFYIRMTRQYLDQYNVGGVYPWRWKDGHKDKEHRNAMRRAYVALLTKEEIACGGFVSHNTTKKRMGKHLSPEKHLDIVVKYATI